MLTELRVRNFALVDALNVAFAPGLNVITGETGAGKSILIGALELVLGGRGDRALIRAGEDACQVDAVFELGNAPALDRLLQTAGLPPCENGLLLIRRQLTAGSGGRTIINDAATTVQTLRRIGALLVDMHGPHDQQSLFDPAFQLDLLDAYGDLMPLREPCAQQDAAIRRFRRDRAELGETADLAAREQDLLAYEVAEIEAAALTAEDEDDLVRRHAEAANAEQMLTLGGASAALLDDDETSAFNRMTEAQRQLDALAALLPDAGAWLAEARSIAVQIQELSRALNDRLQGIDIDPDRLQQLDARMALVQKLKRKYGTSVEAIQQRLETSRLRLDTLRDRDRHLAEIDAAIEAAEKQLRKAADRLTRARLEAADNLTRAIQRELRDLGFARAGFSICLSPIDPGPTGGDGIEFAFAPNVGEPERPLRAIASSGEMSRVMLALKRVLADQDRIPVLVFDEIDANIGGETGNIVGQKMRQVAATHQVLCITHLPQVAVHGAHHLVVAKRIENQRTVTRITALMPEARTVEIARMLGGAEQTPLTLDHAAALLQAAAGAPA